MEIYIYICDPTYQQFCFPLTAKPQKTLIYFQVMVLMTISDLINLSGYPLPCFSCLYCKTSLSISKVDCCLEHQAIGDEKAAFVLKPVLPLPDT